MAVTKIETRIPSTAGASSPSGASQGAFGPLDITIVDPTIGGSIADVRQEVDDAFEDMKTFHNMEPDECMRLCGGHSARLSEIRVRIQRIEDFRREWKGVRTREIEPALEELERQWRNASRLHSVRELDFRMESDGRANT